MGNIVILALVLLPFVSTAMAYNRFVAQRQLIRESWSGINSELERRYELIPNLVETVKGVAEFERELLESVTAARAGALLCEGQSPSARQESEEILGRATQALFANAEAYPELQASEAYLELQRELTETENRLARARRFYNANVRAYNTRLGAFPTNLIGRVGKFERAEFFETETSGDGLTVSF